MAVSFAGGTASFRPCQRTMTSMSVVHASSGSMRTISTSSPFLSGNVIFEAVHMARKGKAEFTFQVVVPAHRLLFRPVCIDNGFFVNAVFSTGSLRAFIALWPEYAAPRYG